MKQATSNLNTKSYFTDDYSFSFMAKGKAIVLISMFIISSLTGCGGGERSPAAEKGTEQAFSSENATLTLSWNVNPDQIDGYYIFYGPTGNTAVTQITNTADLTNFDISAPTVSYDAALDLGVQSGQQVCFRIKAYNPNGASGYSNPVCNII